MAEIVEIRWHARGGQGAKTAATFLAEAALHEGKYSQGFPDYGPERMGAPIRGFTRISDKPITLHCAIDHPKIVVVLDDTLLSVVDVCEGLAPDGMVFVNTQSSLEKVKSMLSIDSQKVFVLDATKISIEEIGRPIPNTPMIGALIKGAEVLKLDTIIKDIQTKFSKKFTDNVVQGNIKAIQRAYEEVKQA